MKLFATNIIQRVTTGIFIILFIVISSPVMAESKGLTESPVKPEAFITMFLGLIAVIALIFILAALSRKMKIMQSFTSGHQIKNLASLALSNREKVCLIEVGGKQLLIGVAPGSINSLHVFDESIELDPSQVQPGADNAFSKQLKKALGLSTTDTKQKSGEAA